MHHSPGRSGLQRSSSSGSASLCQCEVKPQPPDYSHRIRNSFIGDKFLLMFHGQPHSDLLTVLFILLNRRKRTHSTPVRQSAKDDLIPCVSYSLDKDICQCSDDPPWETWSGKILMVRIAGVRTDDDRFLRLAVARRKRRVGFRYPLRSKHEVQYKGEIEP